MTERSQDTPADGERSRTLVESAYSSLRHEILSGHLKPGAKLRTEELRLRYKIGASTLREALTRLLGEALVTAEGQRGFRVAPISLSDFSDLTNVRKMIETEALRQSVLAGDEAWEGRVVAAFYRLSKVEERLAESAQAISNDFEQRNRDFHQALISACASPWLHRLNAMLYQQSERYRRISLVNRDVPRDVHAEHQAIYEAALVRDVERVCRLTGEHIDNTLSVVRQVLTRDAAVHEPKPGRSIRERTPAGKHAVEKI
ncbi:MAG: FCD domain-containing protein [Xanthobacteraceae bacterium]|nr:MAG: FCD domain-containing protein [Xanthobacteraceae bacterium]